VTSSCRSHFSSSVQSRSISLSNRAVQSVQSTSKRRPRSLRRSTPTSYQLHNNSTMHKRTKATTTRSLRPPRPKRRAKITRTRHASSRHKAQIRVRAFATRLQPLETHCRSWHPSANTTRYSRQAPSSPMTTTTLTLLLLGHTSSTTIVMAAQASS
jgi:hypothetical protein